MINRIPLDALASFVALAEELHFTRAALHLHIAQPALTKRIQLLERTLGLRLFERTRREVRLSPAGAALLDDARAVLRSTSALAATAEGLRAGGVRPIRVGFTPSAPHHVLPAIVGALRSRWPDLSCTWQEASSQEQMELLQDARLDVGILRPPARVPRGLSCTTFLQEPFVALLPRADRQARSGSIALGELADRTFVLINRRTAATIHDQIRAACTQAGFAPRVGHEASSVAAVVALVAAGCGVSLLPASAADVGVRGVVRRPLRGSPLTTVMAVAYSRRRQPSISITRVVETVTELYPTP